MVTSSAVVGSSAISSLRLAGQRHGDHHPLAHPARELVRVVVAAGGRRRGCRPRSSSVDRLAAWRSRLVAVEVALEHLGDLAADGEHRVERGHRVLEDHRDLAAADLAQLLRRSSLSSSLPVEARPSPRPATPPLGQQPEDGQRGDALAAARLADQPERLARLDVEADAVDGVDRSPAAAPEPTRRSLTDSRSASGLAPSEGCRAAAHRRNFGSRASRSASPSRLKPRHGRHDGQAGEDGELRGVWRNGWVSASIRPHSGMPGSAEPRPRKARPAASMMAVASARVPCDDHRGDRVGQRRARSRSAARLTPSDARGQHVVALALGQHRAAQQPGEDRHVDHADGDHHRRQAAAEQRRRRRSRTAGPGWRA